MNWKKDEIFEKRLQLILPMLDTMKTECGKYEPQDVIAARNFISRLLLPTLREITTRLDFCKKEGMEHRIVGIEKSHQYALDVATAFLKAISMGEKSHKVLHHQKILSAVFRDKCYEMVCDIEQEIWREIS